MTGFPKDVRDIITARAAGACEIGYFCRPAQIHHRRPRGAGGSKRADTNTASNGLALCQACHALVESHRTVALFYGWLVRQGNNPATVPMLRHHYEWVLLADDGTVTAYTGAL